MIMGYMTEEETGQENEIKLEPLLDFSFTMAQI
jgi:hypothetical protein